ncbi:MAG: tetratricopeptide repeat protein, partial [Treponema sp.]|nr:tetratricopeptide repeat protein [Treponema sp.]
MRGLVKRENPAFKKLALAAEAGKAGNYRKAEKILGELITESDAPPEAWLLLGRALHGLKDYSRALAAFNDYLKLRPRSSQGYLFAGRTYLALGLPYKAVPLLRKALDCNPLDLEVMALLGIAYLKSKHSQAAVDLLQEA